MTAPQRERPPTAAGFAPVLAANALPLVGVLALGWDPATLAVIYVLEVLFSFPLAAVTALFAQRPPADHDDENSGVITVSDRLVEKRGSVAVASWLPPVYPRTVPFAVSVVEAGVHFGAVVGIALAATLPGPLAGVLGSPEVALGVAALVVGQSVDTWREYFRTRRYEERTPYAVVETPARRTFFLAFVLFVVAGGADATVVLSALVVTKLLVEWSAHRAQGKSGGRLTAWLAGPDTRTEPPDPIAVPDGEPEACVQTDDRAVLLTGVFRTLVRRAPIYVTWSVIVCVAGLAVIGEDAPPALSVALVASVAVLFTCLLAARAGVFYLGFAHLEYRCYADRVVAYDTLVGEAQWTSPLDVFRDATVLSDSLPDRLLGTRTVGVTTGWGEAETRRYLGPVADAGALVAALDLPVETDLAPIDRRVAALTIGIALAAVAVGVAALIGGEGDVVLSGVFVCPFVAFPLWALWRRAYPERSERAVE
jgi:hypothetical protein